MPAQKELHIATIGKCFIRLYKDDGEEESYRIIYSYNGTRMETFEYDNQQKAREDFRLMCSVVTNILRCEKLT